MVADKAGEHGRPERYLEPPVYGRGAGVAVEAGAGGGEQSPEQQGEPPDDAPAEENVEQQDDRDAVTAVNGDHGGYEVQESVNAE